MVRLWRPALMIQPLSVSTSVTGHGRRSEMLPKKIPYLIRWNANRLRYFKNLPGLTCSFPHGSMDNAEGYPVLGTQIWLWLLLDRHRLGRLPHFLSLLYLVWCSGSFPRSTYVEARSMEFYLILQELHSMNTAYEDPEESPCIFNQENYAIKSTEGDLP